MNIRERIEDWLLNKFAGKLVARAAVTIAAYVAGPVVQGLAAKAGVSISINPGELEAALIVGAHGVFEWFKARRMANPASPAVQTDKSKIEAPPIP